MTLRLADPVSYVEPIDHWPLPSESKYIESPELLRLCGDIERYARRRVSGRSYLIAGHRGVGKTSLATRAVELIWARVMNESAKDPSDYLTGGPFQRPLLVKLEGPSMLADEPAQPAAKKPEPAGGDAAKKDKAAAGDDAEAEAADAKETAADDKNTARAHAALVQITIALYRALAAEAATGYRAHALQSFHDPETPPGDALERAAQLALDLDGGAEAAALRDYWAGIGRLEEGVFWPAEAGANLGSHGMSDQGVREITALATAAQAFQVCTGRIRYETKVKDSLLRERIDEIKATSDLRETLTRLGTLGLGALTSVSILATVDSGPSAIVGGLAVWILGSFTISRSEKRTRTSDRQLDYSFIRDKSPGTLGRDLPVVIERVREAGLAPVFIIDELDKVRDAPKALAGIVGKLKHLIADYGFFCFLVNRDCFDAIETKVRNLSYPSEHTLFGSRMLLRPDPAATLAYLLKIIEFDEADPQSGQARTAFALNAMHAAQLNLTDLTRYLARAQRTATGEIGKISELTAQRKLVIATIQLAIDETLRGPQLVERMDDDPIFAQLAMDTVYYPSRQLRKGEVIVDPSADALRAHLVERMTQETGSETAPAGDDPVRPPVLFPLSEPDLGHLHNALVALLRRLADLETLRDALGMRHASGQDASSGNGDYRLASIPPVDVVYICEELGDGRFRFLFGADGEGVERDPAILTRAEKTRAKQLIAYANEFKLLVEAAGATIDELAATPLLESVAAATIAEAVAELGTALRLNEANPEVRQHFSTLERLFEEVRRNSLALATLLRLCASLERDVPNARQILPAIARLIRYQAPPARWIADRENAPPTRPLPADDKGLRSWRNGLAKDLLPAIGSLDRDPAVPFLGIVESLRRFFAHGKKPPPLNVTYAMFVDAVRGDLPAAALASDMKRMSAYDWSRLALAAVPAADRKEKPAPYWMLIAGLRGAGFGREALLELADNTLLQSLKESGWTVEAPGMDSAVCFTLAMEFAKGAPSRRPGILVIDGPENFFAASAPNSKVPTLVVDVAAYKAYVPFFDWLAALGIIVARAVGMDREGDID